MISLILYGRNDSYGYNLHKRAAISLNCMAEMLTAPDDEIIFVDYNTPNDFPTFPEAIQDTLTDRAKKLLRILRVRPRQHEQFRHRTHLVALEPIARNVAIRRSNPANRWVLSTNTDMVFVPQRNATLSEIVAKLPDAYYPLPRFEVPESLWESADRLDPQATIAAFGTWGLDFHLNEIVLGGDSTVKYDAPGDFQLVLRSDLWRMHAFHEEMLLGWHVDSNLAKRLALLPQRAGEVLNDVFGYHCDHTRQVTPAHKPRALENDLGVFYEEVATAELPAQADSWGLAEETVEEVSVSTTSRLYIQALRATIDGPPPAPMPHVHYSLESHNHIDYSVEHVLPFIADSFASYPRDAVLSWYGSKKSLLARFAKAWKAMGFSQDILVSPKLEWLGPALPPDCKWVPEEKVLSSSDAFLFDWGRRDDISAAQWEFSSDIAVRGVLRGLRLAVREERRRFAESREPRRFVGINAVANDAERIFHDLVGAARTPIATRIRQGYVNDVYLQQELLTGLNAGAAGRKSSGRIVSRPGVSGCIFYGPYLLLDSGRYCLRLEFDIASGEAELEFAGIGIEVISNGCLVGNRLITPDELRVGIMKFEVLIPTDIGSAEEWPETEFRLRTTGRVGIAVRRAMLEPSTSAVPDTNRSVFDFLPLLTVGLAGSHELISLDTKNAPNAIAIRSKSDVAGFVAYGPHVWLLPGHYEATYEFVAPPSQREHGVDAHVEVVAGFGNEIFAEEFVSIANGRAEGTLSFDVHTEAPPDAKGLLEIRIWSQGVVFNLVALTVRRVGPPRLVENRIERLFGGRLAPVLEATARRIRSAHLEHLPAQDVLWLMLAGPQGRRAIHTIEASANANGIVAYGPYISLLPGRYDATFEFYAQRATAGSQVKLDVAGERGTRIFAERVVRPFWNGRRFERVFGKRRGRLRYTLSFEITTDTPHENGLLEFRVWSHGPLALKMTAVRVRQVDSP